MLRHARPALLAAFAGLVFASVSYGQAATFAAFNVKGRDTQGVGNTNYLWTNNGDGTGSMISTFAMTFQAFGNYQSSAETLTGGAFPDNGLVAATCVLNIGSSGAGVNAAGFTIQPIAGTLTVTADTAIAGLTNLLTMNFTGAIIGRTGGSQVTIQAATPLDVVNYTSQFASFGGSTDRSYSMSGTGLDNPLGLASGIMTSWTSDFTSSGFSADFVGVPEPSTFAMLGLVGVGGFYVQRRRKQKALAQAAAEAAKAKPAVEPALA